MDPYPISRRPHQRNAYISQNNAENLFFPGLQEVIESLIENPGIRIDGGMALGIAMRANTSPFIP